MNVHQAADLFLRWADTQGFLADSAILGPPVTAIEAALIKPISEIGIGVLRTKHIQAVLVDETGGKIIALLRRAVPSAKLLKSLPALIDDVPIEYRQGLQNPVEDTQPVPTSGPIYRVRAVAGKDRYTCGSSISVGNSREAGTLGCLVKSNSGKILGLTNNHVSGSCSFAEIGLPILAPGVYDVAAGSLPPFTIGFHETALPLVAGSPGNVDVAKNSDAAVFLIRDETLVSSFQGDSYDTPTNVGQLVSGMTVEKVGRTTGRTTGVVVGQIHGPFSLPYSSKHFNFSGRVYLNGFYQVRGSSDLFSDSGDSGSLVTTIEAGQRKAVGLVVGAMTDGRAPGGKASLVLPIDRILTELKVSLISGHNT